jgi:hypothetical protein
MVLDSFTMCKRKSAYSVPKTCPCGVAYLPGGHRCRGPTDGPKKQWFRWVYKVYFGNLFSYDDGFMQHKHIPYWNRRMLLMRHKISIRVGLAYMFTTTYLSYDLAGIQDNEANPQTRDSVKLVPAERLHFVTGMVK